MASYVQPKVTLDPLRRRRSIRRRPFPASVPVNQATPPSKNPHLALGPAVPMGGGHIQTYAMLNPSGRPIEVGVYFTASALTSLPAAPSDGRWDTLLDDGSVWHCCGHEHFLSFSPEVESQIPFE